MLVLSLRRVERKLRSSSSLIPSNIWSRIEMPFCFAPGLSSFAFSVSTNVFARLSCGFCLRTTKPFFSIASTSLVTEFLSFCSLSASCCCVISPWFQRMSISMNCSGVNGTPISRSFAARNCFNLQPVRLSSTAISLRIQTSLRLLQTT